MAQEAAVRTIDRALRVLAAFDGDRSEMGVTEMAGLLDVHVSTASRLAATLAAHRFLERASAGEAYRLGPEVLRLGLLAAGDDLTETARGTMEELAAETGETVVLSVPSGHVAVAVAQVDARYLVGGKSWIGRRWPLHATSDGKALLAFGAADLRPGEALEPATPRTITDVAELTRHLSDVRTQGWASSIGECEDGLNGVAAPIFTLGGRCVAALSVSAPAYRLAPEAMPKLAARCRRAADAVSARLGAPAARGETSDGVPKEAQ